jgi:hypothetical protein
MRPPSHVLLAVVLTVSLFGGVAVAGAVAPAEQVPESAVSADPVPVENGSTYWRGQVLSFSVEGSGVYEVRAADGGELVTQLEASDGSASLETTALSPGEYVLSNASSGSVAYQFAVARQRFAAAAADGGVDVESNRASYAVAVESADLSTSQLRSLFPEATERNGTVVITEVGASQLLATDSSAVDDGEYEITLRVRDADASTSVSLSVSAPETRTTTTLTTVDGGAEGTDRATGESTTDRGANPEPTASATETDDSSSSSGLPGFGVPTALVVVALAVGLAAARGRR